MIPVANFLQVIILIVHGYSPGHIPQQCQPKGAESEAELGRTWAFLAKGAHYPSLLQRSPLQVPELYLATGKTESLGSWRTPTTSPLLLPRGRGGLEESACEKVSPLWARFAKKKVARSAAGRRAAEGGGRTGMHVIPGLTSQTDGQALCSAGVWQVGSPARLLAAFPLPPFFLLLLLLLLLPSKNSYKRLSAKSPNRVFTLPACSWSERAFTPWKVNLAASLCLPAARTREFPSPRRCCAAGGGHRAPGLNPAGLWQGSSAWAPTPGGRGHACDVGRWQIILIPYMLCYIPFQGIFFFLSAFTIVGSLSSTNLSLLCLYWFIYM